MKLAKSKKMWILGIIAILLLIPVLLFIVFFGNRPNYAEEAAKPIEQALLDAGATKVCSSGDDGRGVDSRAPDYGATFKTSLSKDRAIESIKQIAASNGHKLTQADSSYDYISSFFDHTTVKNAYSDLQSGPALLGMSIYSGGDNLSCPGTDLKYDAEHVAIKMNISLPSFK